MILQSYCMGLGISLIHNYTAYCMFLLLLYIMYGCVCCHDNIILWLHAGSSIEQRIMNEIEVEVYLTWAECCD